MKIGAKTKLTPERAAVIIRALGSGASERRAAIAAGVSQRTIGNWLRWGKADPDGPYGEFYRTARRAELEGRMAVLRDELEALATKPVSSLRTKGQ